MSIKYFEYCALSYLNQWLEYDKSFCEKLASGNNEEKLSALKKAGMFYKVARNLPTKFDEEQGKSRYEPVLGIIDCLDSHCFGTDQATIVENIERYAKKISDEYGGAGTRSLTTKFLWLKVKQPILIYDSQARNALGAKDGDLYAYYKQWRSEYEYHKVEIKSVCKELGKLWRFSFNPAVGTKEYIDEISAQKWFQERVFDTYLWNKGR